MSRRSLCIKKDKSVRWYADNSELNGIKEAEIPDILIFGGICVSPEIEIDLRKSIELAKAEFGPYRAPVKWNFKDLKRQYQKEGREEVYNELLKSSKDWRRRIFEEASKHDFKIIIACVESHSASKKVIRSLKEDLTRFVFNNGLMRYGLHVQEEQPYRAEVVLDWPDRGDSKPFDSEYAWAYLKGTTPENVPYHCGKLESLCFHDSVVYTNMSHSVLLQFADLIVGATRECIEVCLEKKKSGYGIEMLQIVKDKFRGYPNNIVGRGVSVAASQQSKLKEKIQLGITNLVVNA